MLLFISFEIVSDKIKDHAKWPDVDSSKIAGRNDEPGFHLNVTQM